MGNAEKNPGQPSGDVDNIRRILFGDQIAQIEERFQQNETAIAQLRSENRNLRQALEEEVTARENVNRELHSLLDAQKEEQDGAWSRNLAAQAKLAAAVEKALEQFKAEIGAPARKA